jgi:purine-binding chemotaxis protein CheW
MTGSQSILGFRVSDQLFCINLFAVKRVILFTEMKPVPGLPEFFVGLLNLQGQNIPVIDLCKRLGLEKVEEYTIDTPIILVQDDDHQMGLVVDEVVGIDSAKATKIEVNKLVKNKISGLHEGVVHIKEGDALKLNIECLFEEALTV